MIVKSKETISLWKTQANKGLSRLNLWPGKWCVAIWNSSQLLCKDANSLNRTCNALCLIVFNTWKVVFCFLAFRVSNCLQQSCKIADYSFFRLRWKSWFENISAYSAMKPQNLTFSPQKFKKSLILQDSLEKTVTIFREYFGFILRRDSFGTTYRTVARCTMGKASVKKRGARHNATQRDYEIFQEQQ